MRGKQALKNMVASLLLQVIVLLSGLILPRFILEAYGSSVNGMITSVNQFLTYLGLAEAGVGTATVVALYTPLALKQTEEVNSILSATRKFYNKSCKIADYIVFISPIKLLNNTRQNYKFDLIYSEDLGLNNYSGVELHCCLNIYGRPKNELNKKISNKLKDVSIYREDDKKYNEILEDFKICRMGCKVWKILDTGQELRNFKIIVNNKKYLNQIIEILNNKYKADGNNRDIVISTPYIAKDDIYKYINEQIPEIK